MSMSDCGMCWESPCSCGWDYRHWPVSRLIEHRDMLQALIDGTHVHSVSTQSKSGGKDARA